MTVDSNEIELLAVLILLFAYTIAGVLLAGGQRTLGSWLAIVGGSVAGLVEIVAILRRM